MGTYRPEPPYTTNGLRPAILQTFTPEEKAAYRHWGRTLLALFCSLFVLSGIAILAKHSISNSSNEVAQVSHPQDVP